METGADDTDSSDVDDVANVAYSTDGSDGTDGTDCVDDDEVKSDVFQSYLFGNSTSLFFNFIT